MTRYIVKKTEYATVEADTKWEAEAKAADLPDGAWDFESYDAEKEWP